MHEAGQLCPAAVNLTTEYVSNFPRKGQENDNKSDSDDDDVGNTCSDDGDVIEVDSGNDDSSANDDEDNKDYD